MSIKSYQGDIFLSPAQIIIQQCNCFCTMGSGIALEIRKRYPSAFYVDSLTKRGDHNKMGTFSISLSSPEQDRTIINLYSQYFYGRDRRHTDYDSFRKGMESIEKYLSSSPLKDKIVGIPHKIGCALGGGDWAIVENIISDVFQNSNIEVFICQK